MYQLSKHLRLKDRNFLTLDQVKSDLGKEFKAVMFIDDVIGRGNQATKFFSRHLENLQMEKYYYSLIAFEDGLRNVKANSGFQDVFSVTRLSEDQKVFSESSVIIRDPDLRNRTKEIAQEYGEQLYPLGPLGYDDSQALIAFSYNTPNNTLPIIWASSNNEKAKGMNWNPLFERKKIT
jgi:hypothetical protein